MALRETTRREFVKRSALAAASGAMAPYFAWNHRAFANHSPNGRPRIGCIGVGSMGMQDAPGHAAFGDIVAVCDVDSKHAEQARMDKNVGKGKAQAYGDYRKVLERKDIDVACIATPDHWHVKIAIAALEAGKHVFCQKPLTLTLEENQRVRDAARKHPGLVFAVGTQQRAVRGIFLSHGKFLRAVNMVQKGLLGDVRKITVAVGGGEVGGPFPKSPPPPELNWDFWLGQAPKVEYIKERGHYQFRWWYEYSGGKFTDWGAHHVDIATWAIGQDKEGMGPIEIDGTDAKHPVPFKDGYPTVDDCYNTAHDFAVKCKFAGGIEMLITSRGQNGILFEGTKGRIFVDRGRITGKPIEENWDKDKFVPEDLTRLYKGKPPEEHKQNFYRCVREGGLPLSDVFSHVQAMNTCHLAAIAARLGRVVHWNSKTEKITGDDQAAALFARNNVNDMPNHGFVSPHSLMMFYFG